MDQIYRFKFIRGLVLGAEFIETERNHAVFRLNIY